MTDTYSDPFSTIHPQDHLAMAGLQQDSAAMGRTGPSINKGKSKQDYATPADFMGSFYRRFGAISFDLAASLENCKNPNFFSESEDSLSRDWSNLPGQLFLNPPFGNIDPWVRKCAMESDKGATILLLAPASVGSVWYAEHVHQKAMVYFLRPRLSFDGVNAFPRDCMLAYYHNKASGYDLWKWK